MSTWNIRFCGGIKNIFLILPRIWFYEGLPDLKGYSSPDIVEVIHFGGTPQPLYNTIGGVQSII